MASLKLYLRYLASFGKKDQISFQVESEIDHTEDPEGWEWKHTDILINGKSLFKRLEDYEMSEAKRTGTDVSLAGKYVGIDPVHLYKKFKKGSTNRFSGWQCSHCRSAGCATNLECDYKVRLFSVELSNFRQVPRPTPFNNTKEVHPETLGKVKWNYEAFLPLKFKKNDFFREVSCLKPKA